VGIDKQAYLSPVFRAPPKIQSSRDNSYQPFPLEYEGKVTKENRAAFERRRAAMIRHYRSRLGAQLLDDYSPDRWMWIDTGCPIKPRKLRRKGARKNRSAAHIIA